MRMRFLLYLFSALFLNLHTVNAYSIGRPSCDACLTGSPCSLFKKWRCLVNQRNDKDVQSLVMSEDNVVAKRARLPYPFVDYSGTTFYYLFKQEKVVLSFRVNGGELPGISDMMLYEFESVNPLPEIENWLEGISTDYATIMQPLNVYDVDASDFTFTISSMQYIARMDVRNEFESRDETLDVFQLDFEIHDVTINDHYTLNRLSETVRAYVTVESTPY